MNSKIWLDGNQLARKCISIIRDTIQAERSLNAAFYELHPQWSQPQLDIINLGFDDASLSYIKKKIDLASSIGIRFELHQFMDEGDKGLRGAKGLSGVRGDKHGHPGADLGRGDYFSRFSKIMKQSLPNNFSIKELTISDPHKCQQ